MAILSAVFAALTAILAKCGIRKTDSDVATALRTVVVLVFSWLMVFVVGSAGTIGQIGTRSLTFLILSGLATGASWICYFKALSLGDVNKVVPIDKSSTILTVLLAIIIFNETNNLPVKLAAYLGLRRSEIIGLKWSAVDFEQNTITINHTVTSCNLDGKCVIVAKDTTKTKSSRRTLPLVPYFHEKLLAVKAQQEKIKSYVGAPIIKNFWNTSV